MDFQNVPTLRIKKDIHIDGLAVNNEPLRYGYIIIRSLPPEQVHSLYDLLSVEIPLSQAQNLAPYPESGCTFQSMHADIFRWLMEEAEFYIEGRLDEVIDLRALTLDSLANIRCEYEMLNWWDDVSEEYLTDTNQHIYAITELLDELIDSRDGTDIRERMFRMFERTPRPGYIYLLKSSEGFWKIGKATDPKNRMKTFKIYLPFDVEYEHLIPTTHMTQAERAMHERFADKRVKGEWFSLDAADIAYIKSIKHLNL